MIIKNNVKTAAALSARVEYLLYFSKNKYRPNGRKEKIKMN